MLVLLVAAYAYDHSRRDLIAPGVKAAGVPVGGLRAADATTKLRSVLGARLRRPVTLTVHGRRFTLAVASLGPRVDVDALVSRAVSASRGGWFLGRTADSITGARKDVDVAAPVTYNRSGLNRFVADVARQVDRPAADATVQPTLKKLRRVRQHDGYRVDQASARARLAAAIARPALPRSVSVGVAVTHPKITLSQLAAHYPSYVIIDRAGYQLRWYKHLKLSRTYPIAVGMQGLETPAGLYHVQWKQVNPPWMVPNSSWAGSLAGRTIPPGPQDPLKARFISFNGSAGIHGIDPSEYGSIGHNASHGCVRMTIPDVIELYKHVPVGSPVFVG